MNNIRGSKPPKAKRSPLLRLFIDNTIVRMSLNEMQSHVLHRLLCLRTVRSQTESNVPHPKACGNFTNRTLPICNVYFSPNPYG